MSQATSRDSFLQRVRTAAQAGNRAGQRPELPQRGQLGYQGGGHDPTAFFGNEFTKVGGFLHRTSSPAETVRIVCELIQKWEANHILVGRGEFVDSLDLRGAFQNGGRQVVLADETGENERRDVYFAADVGVTGVDMLIAETGTIVVTAKQTEPRSPSLLPPYHIAVAHERQIVPDLFDVFDAVSPTETPSNLTLITGPSKTGDIELRLVTGVHGPREVHVILQTGS